MVRRVCGEEGVWCGGVRCGGSRSTKGEREVELCLSMYVFQ